MKTKFYNPAGDVVEIDVCSTEHGMQIHNAGFKPVRTHNADGSSKRKPFNNRAGYVASKKNLITGTSNVIYIAAEQGVDSDGKYITVCEGHNTMISRNRLVDARDDMKNATEWCEECRSVNTEPAAPVKKGRTMSASKWHKEVSYIQNQMPRYKACMDEGRLIDHCESVLARLERRLAELMECKPVDA